MKRILTTVLAVFAVVSPASAAYSPSVNEVLSWTDTKVNIIRQNLREAARNDLPGANDVYCITQQSWRPQFLSRLRLGYQEADDFFQILWGKNRCLQRDILEIENRIGQVTEAVFRLKPACLLPEDAEKLNQTLDETIEFINQLSFIKETLYEFGDIPAEKYETANIVREYEDIFGTEMPAELKQALPLSHESYYSDESCPEPQSFFSFMQAKAALARLMEGIEDLKSAGKELTDVSGRFAAAKSYYDEERLEQIRKRARYRASAWFENNIVRNFQISINLGGLTVEGGDYIIKDPDEVRAQKQRNKRKLETKAPDAKTPRDVIEAEPIQEPHEIIRQVEKSEHNRDEAIQFNTEADSLLIQVGEIDRKLLDTLDRNPVKIIQTFERKNEFIEEATEAVRDLCNSMPTCE